MRLCSSSLSSGGTHLDLFHEVAVGSKAEEESCVSEGKQNMNLTNTGLCSGLQYGENNGETSPLSHFSFQLAQFKIEKFLLAREQLSTSFTLAAVFSFSSILSIKSLRFAR